MSTYDVTFETLNDVYSIHSGHESFIIPKDFSTPLTIKGTLWGLALWVKEPRMSKE